MLSEGLSGLGVADNGDVCVYNSCMLRSRVCVRRRSVFVHS